MLGGFNTNVPYKGIVYHIQTEDGGSKSRVIFTQLYHQGAILYTRQFNYADIIKTEGWEREVFLLMKRQHDSVIDDLTAGRLSIGEESEPKEEDIVDSKASMLDDIVIDYIVGR